VVAVVGFGTRSERDVRSRLAELEAELAALRARAERHDRWLDALATLADTFMHDTGPDVVHESLDVLIRQTRATDAALATYVGGRLALRGSRRGVLNARTLTVAAHPDLGRALRDAQGIWLDATAAHVIGLPPGLHASGVPIAVAGEVLGLLLMVFDEVEPHDADNRRLLASISSGVAFAVLRDRLARELRAAVSPAARSGRRAAGGRSTA
jgi:K+-sensing histidine kinase KdpD